MFSFLEFWGERVDPGKVGSIGVADQHERCQWRPLVILRFLFVVIGLPVFWYLAVSQIPFPAWQSWILVVGGTLIYVAIAYLIDPKPDMDNLGWAGGLMNNPCRWSDNVNQWILFVGIVLAPGRFVAESLLDFFPSPSSNENPSFDSPSHYRDSR